MSQPHDNLSDRRYNDIEVYNHTDLEVAGEPQSMIANNGYQQDPGPHTCHYQGDKPDGTPYYRQSQCALGNQGSQEKEVQRKWVRAMITTSAVVSTLLAGGAVGAGLGSSLAKGRASPAYAYPSNLQTLLYP